MEEGKEKEERLVRGLVGAIIGFIVLSVIPPFTYMYPGTFLITGLLGAILGFLIGYFMYEEAK